MSSSPLQAVGGQQSREAVVEVCVPLLAAGLGWYLVHDQLGELVPGAPFTDEERLCLLAATMVLTGWAVARQLVLYGRRAPRSTVGLSIAFSAAALLTASKVTAGQLEGDCSDQGGVLADVAPTEKDPPPRVELACQVGAVPGNAYLPGRLLRPAWDGGLTPAEWAALLLAAGVGAVGLRDRRLLRTRVPAMVFNDLPLAAAAGASGALGTPGVTGARVVACANLTLWGELCGQLYSADKAFLPGEWCLRCCQVFRPIDREVTFKVVSLFSADIDVLNGLERMDTVSWPQGEPMPADARLSGQERWAQLGTITMPDTVSVAQLLSFVHGELDTWSGEVTDEQKAPFVLAKARASRIHAWIWSGSLAHRLTYARPTLRTRLGIGPTRLRDLGLDPGEELWLQLDIGLLPLELRLGFRRSFLDPTRAPVVQNTRQNLWIPVAPPRLAPDREGLWVPRLEGDALRTWLSTEQRRAKDRPGSTTPLPHRGAGDARLGAPPSGPMDFVRRPIIEETGELEASPWPGTSISEWKWMEAEQVELLRRECLVLVDNGGSR